MGFCLERAPKKHDLTCLVQTSLEENSDFNNQTVSGSTIIQKSGTGLLYRKVEQDCTFFI